MRNVLRNDGYFMINEMHCDDNQTPAQKTHILLHHWWSEVDSRLEMIHNKTYTSQQIEDMVKTLELKEMEVFEYAYSIPDPLDPKMIETYISYFDPYVDRLKDHADYEALKSKGDELKDRLREVGFSPASSLFILGRK